MRRLQHSNDWKQLLESSKMQPVVVFKHSTTCGISSQALQDFQEFCSGQNSISCAVVHVVEDRNLSDVIGRQMGVRHESPQVIAIEGERSIWHASHWRIDLSELEDLLRKYRRGSKAS